MQTPPPNILNLTQANATPDTDMMDMFRRAADHSGLADIIKVSRDLNGNLMLNWQESGQSSEQMVGILFGALVAREIAAADNPSLRLSEYRSFCKL